jgi:hypothetical protein
LLKENCKKQKSLQKVSFREHMYAWDSNPNRRTLRQATSTNLQHSILLPMVPVPAHLSTYPNFSCFLQFSSILTDHQHMNVILAFKSLMESMKLCCHILHNLMFCREKREWNSKRITNMKLTNARKMCCKNGSKKERLPVIEALMNSRYCLNNILWVEKQQKITLNPQDSSEGKAMAAL